MSTIITKLSVRWTPHRSKYSVVHTLFRFTIQYFCGRVTDLLIVPHGRSSTYHHGECL
jgi:hypothetical protein